MILNVYRLGPFREVFVHTFKTWFSPDFSQAHFSLYGTTLPFQSWMSQQPYGELGLMLRTDVQG